MRDVLRLVAESAHVNRPRVPVIIIRLSMFPDRLRDFMPSGSRSCVTSPAAGLGEKKKKDKMRNKEARAAGLKNI
jgi:hypothetical protein